MPHIQSINEMNEMHKSALGEIGNIGMGNAAKSLSYIMDETLSLEIPAVRFLGIDEIAGLLGGMESVVVAALATLSGGVTGYVLLVSKKEFVAEVLKKLFPDDIDISDNNFTEMQLSAITELSNIFIGSYSSAVATFLDVDIKTSLPSLCIDMVGAVLTSPAAEMCSPCDKIIVIENYIESHKNTDAFSHIFYVPDSESYEKIIEKLGIPNG